MTAVPPAAPAVSDATAAVANTIATGAVDFGFGSTSYSSTSFAGPDFSGMGGAVPPPLAAAAATPTAPPSGGSADGGGAVIAAAPTWTLAGVSFDGGGGGGSGFGSFHFPTAEEVRAEREQARAQHRAELAQWMAHDDARGLLALGFSDGCVLRLRDTDQYGVLRQMLLSSSAPVVPASPAAMKSCVAFFAEHVHDSRTRRGVLPDPRPPPPTSPRPRTAVPTSQSAASGAGPAPPVVAPSAPPPVVAAAESVPPASTPPAATAADAPKQEADAASADGDGNGDAWWYRQHTERQFVTRADEHLLVTRLLLRLEAGLPAAAGRSGSNETNDDHRRKLLLLFALCNPTGATTLARAKDRTARAEDAAMEAAAAAAAAAQQAAAVATAAAAVASAEAVAVVVGPLPAATAASTPPARTTTPKNLSFVCAESLAWSALQALLDAGLIDHAYADDPLPQPFHARASSDEDVYGPLHVALAMLPAWFGHVRSGLRLDRTDYTHSFEDRKAARDAQEHFNAKFLRVMRADPKTWLSPIDGDLLLYAHGATDADDASDDWDDPHGQYRAAQARYVRQTASAASATGTGNNSAASVVAATAAAAGTPAPPPPATEAVAVLTVPTATAAAVAAASDEYRGPPLPLPATRHETCMGGVPRVLLQLIDATPRHILNRGGMCCALRLALVSGHARLVQYLLAHDQSPEAPPRHDLTERYDASECGAIELPLALPDTDPQRLTKQVLPAELAREVLRPPFFATDPTPPPCTIQELLKAAEHARSDFDGGSCRTRAMGDRLERTLPVLDGAVRKREAFVKALPAHVMALCSSGGDGHALPKELAVLIVQYACYDAARLSAPTQQELIAAREAADKKRLSDWLAEHHRHTQQHGDSSRPMFDATMVFGADAGGGAVAGGGQPPVGAQPSAGVPFGFAAAVGLVAAGGGTTT